MLAKQLLSLYKKKPSPVLVTLRYPLSIGHVRYMQQTTLGHRSVVTGGVLVSLHLPIQEDMMQLATTSMPTVKHQLQVTLCGSNKSRLVVKLVDQSAATKKANIPQHQ